MGYSGSQQSRQSQTIAGIYCRMSLAADDDTTKVSDQERICRDLARAKGWRIAEGVGVPEPNGVYADNSRSAWRLDRKRPAWDQMLDDLKDGKLGAIVVYHGDRLIRRQEDLSTLIGLARNKGIRLASPIGERDLDNDDDQFILEIECSMAKRESANTSRRRKAQYERWRREGRVRPGGRGGRAFGFATDGLTHIAPECQLVRAAADMILDGQPTGQVAVWLNEQGALTPTGGAFQHGTVRKMLARPRYAGLMPDGEHEAAWEPVYDPDRAKAIETWQAVCSVLGSRSAQFPYATNARKYLLSGIARCGVCQSGLQIRAEHRRTHLTGYGCVQPGCRKVQRSQAHLDRYVTIRLVARLAHPLNPAGHLPDGAGGPGCGSGAETPAPACSALTRGLAARSSRRCRWLCGGRWCRRASPSPCCRPAGVGPGLTLPSSSLSPGDAHKCRVPPLSLSGTGFCRFLVRLDPR